MGSKEHAAMIGIDLSKAFDCLSHELMLSKLKAYDLSESSVTFLASFLPNRFQRVNVGHASSRWLFMRTCPKGLFFDPYYLSSPSAMICHSCRPTVLLIRMPMIFFLLFTIHATLR